MGDQQIIRAWKDADFRASLGDGAGDLPDSPAGTIELADEDIGDQAGGMPPIVTQTSICVTTLPCVTIVAYTVSNAISCGTCETTLWHGTCGASTIGCC